MKNITLKAGQNLTVTTPNGQVVIGITNPYHNNSQPNALIYFTRDGGAEKTKVASIADVFSLFFSDSTKGQ